MKIVKVTENRIIRPHELTAFVREVVLPGSLETVPKLDSSACRFDLKFDRSPIHRWGVFAAERIPARRRVIEYTGQKINAQEAWRRRVRQHLYLFRLNRKWVIDGAFGGSGAEFINHSCNPNLYARAGGGRIFFVSYRAIATAEELTLDYNVINNGTDLPCTCGAEKCRGIINRNS